MHVPIFVLTFPVLVWFVHVPLDSLWQEMELPVGYHLHANLRSLAVPAEVRQEQVLLAYLNSGVVMDKVNVLTEVMSLTAQNVDQINFVANLDNAWQVVNFVMVHKIATIVLMKSFVVVKSNFNAL